MKLVMAIVSRDDSKKVLRSLTKNRFMVTTLASTGGFLLSGNTTFLIGLEDERLEEALTLIREHSKKRAQYISPNTSYDMEPCAPFPVEITVGGATAFILNVERFEKF